MGRHDQRRSDARESPPGPEPSGLRAVGNRHDAPARGLPHRGVEQGLRVRGSLRKTSGYYCAVATADDTVTTARARVLRAQILIVSMTSGSYRWPRTGRRPVPSRGCRDRQLGSSSGDEGDDCCDSRCGVVVEDAHAGSSSCIDIGPGRRSPQDWHRAGHHKPTP
jgi:hypothetical protein